MLAIKLQRVGKKHQPSYRFVVAEKRSKMGGPPVEDLGSYNPFTKTSSLNKERISYWITMGAQPTVSVHNLLVEQKVVTGATVAVKMNKPEAKAPEPEAPKAAVPEAAAASKVEAPESAIEAPAAAEPAAPATDATETAPAA